MMRRSFLLSLAVGAWAVGCGGSAADDNCCSGPELVVEESDVGIVEGLAKFDTTNRHHVLSVRPLVDISYGGPEGGLDPGGVVALAFMWDARGLSSITSGPGGTVLLSFDSDGDRAAASCWLIEESTRTLEDIRPAAVERE